MSDPIDRIGFAARSSYLLDLAFLNLKRNVTTIESVTLNSWRSSETAIAIGVCDRPLGETHCMQNRVGARDDRFPSKVPARGVTDVRTIENERSVCLERRH